MENPGSIAYIVSRSFFSVGAVSVTVTPVGQSATAGTDFVAAPATFTWADGDSTTRQFTVTIMEDKKSEGDETFSVTLSGVTGGAGVDVNEPRPVTITDDDHSGGGGRFGAIVTFLLGFAGALRRYSRAMMVLKPT